MMRKLIMTALLALSFGSICMAQALPEEESLGPKVVLDSLLFGRNLRELGVKVVTSGAVHTAEAALIEANGTKFFSGFRVRIYQSSSQTAREASLAAMERFNAAFPEIPVYRGYQNPYFRVTAGNYRSRMEAEEALGQIKSDFPDATVIRDKFKFPSR